jgi:hypothetical protein
VIGLPDETDFFWICQVFALVGASGFYYGLARLGVPLDWRVIATAIAWLTLAVGIVPAVS